MRHDEEALDRGARNLLLSCAGARPGESLLIVCEEPGSDYVEAGVAAVAARTARSLGLVVETLELPFHADAAGLSPEHEAAIGGFDHTLFLSRLGDQLRFRPASGGPKPIVSHALDLSAFASDFCGAPYAAFQELKGAFNDLFSQADEIQVSCDLGTDFSSRRTPDAGGEPRDVSIKRFPMCIFAPIPAAQSSGVVAVAHLLVGTGSRYYTPYGLRLGASLRARIDNGRIVEWLGDADEVRLAKAHYDHVARLFDIDGAAVHSWHVGIHPGCGYSGSAYDNYERWSNSAFGNPRLLHFHTCGDYPPGEICWNVVDPTIDVDGTRIWDAGRIVIDAVPGAAPILQRYPEVRALFERPERRIGLCDAT